MITFTSAMNDTLNFLSDKMFVNTLTDKEELIFQYLQATFDICSHNQNNPDNMICGFEFSEDMI